MIRRTEPAVPPEGARRCAHCKRVKPFAAFRRSRRTRDGYHSWCRSCCRISNALWRETEEYRAWAREYEHGPERVAAKRETSRRRQARQTERKRTTRATPEGRCANRLSSLKWKLRRATDPARVARLAEITAEYEAVLGRLRAASAC